MSKPKNNQRHAIILGLVLLFSGTNIQPAVTTTAKIISQTSAALPACLQWMVNGVCLWLRCSIYECSIETSIRYTNQAPEAVVTVRNTKTLHPWTEMTSVMATGDSVLTSLIGEADAAGSIEGRHEGGNSMRGRDHQTFREADVVGHPMKLIDYSSMTGDNICPQLSTAFFPYYQSTADGLVWRSILPIESLYPQAWIPGLREIGQFPLNTWGNVYPRTGVVLQQEEPKAGAVLAQRAGDIVTRDYQPHVYVPLPSGGTEDGMKIWTPPLVEADPLTGTWQMLEPWPDVTCYAFGANDAISPISWSDGRKDDGGDYVFTLWRRHSCCEIKGAFIGVIGAN